jgi:hypothetical protein
LKSLNHGAGLGREGGGSGRELIPLGPLLYLLVTCPCGHLTAGLTAGQSSANRGWNTRRSDYLIRFVFVCTCRLDSTPLLILLIKGISNRRWLKTKDVGEDSWRDMSAALSAKSQFPSPPGAVSAWPRRHDIAPTRNHRYQREVVCYRIAFTRQGFLIGQLLLP